MSTTVSEFLNAWNDTMHFQIRESDIKNPTESIFRRLLITLLKEFKVDTQCFENIDNDVGSRVKASRVRLVATVNHFFRIACPQAKQDFVYFDLIHPTHKRCFQVLNYLLNYCIFVRYTFKTTILDLKDKLQERDSLREKKNQLRTETESVKIKEQNNIKAVNDLNSKIPRQKAKIAEHEAESQKLKDELVEVETQFEKSEMDLIEIQNELANVKTLVVSEDEIDSITSAKETIEKQLEEQENESTMKRQNLKESSSRNEELQKIIGKMEKVLSAFKIDTGDTKEKKKLLDDLNSEVSAMKLSIEESQAEIETITQSLEIKKKLISEISEKRKTVKKKFGQRSAKQSKTLKELNNTFRKLTIQEIALSNENKRLKNELNQLYNVAGSVVKHIKKQIFEQPNAKD